MILEIEDHVRFVVDPTSNNIADVEYWVRGLSSLITFSQDVSIVSVCQLAVFGIPRPFGPIRIIHTADTNFKAINSSV